jgi:hypothetical protein
VLRSGGIAACILNHRLLLFVQKDSVPNLCTVDESKAIHIAHAPLPKPKWCRIAAGVGPRCGSHRSNFPLPATLHLGQVELHRLYEKKRSSFEKSIRNTDYRRDEGLQLMFETTFGLADV